MALWAHPFGQLWPLWREQFSEAAGMTAQGCPWTNQLSAHQWRQPWQGKAPQGSQQQEHQPQLWGSLGSQGTPFALLPAPASTNHSQSTQHPPLSRGRAPQVPCACGMISAQGAGLLLPKLAAPLEACPRSDRDSPCLLSEDVSWPLAPYFEPGILTGTLVALRTHKVFSSSPETYGKIQGCVSTCS